MHFSYELPTHSVYLTVEQDLAQMSLIEQVKRAATSQATSWSLPAWAPRLRVFLRWLASTAQWLIALGTQSYPADVARRLAVMNVIAYMIGVTTFGFVLQHISLDYEKFAPVIWLNFILVFTAIAVPFSHRYGELCGGLIIIVSEYIALMLFTYYLGRDAGVHLQYFIAASAAIVVFGIQRWWITIPCIVIGIALEIIAWYSFPQHLAAIDAPQAVVNNIYFQAATSTGVLTAAAVYYAFTLAEAAKAETDALLRNILPDSIVERLKSKDEDVIADSFEEASILFADISGFVALARSLGAEKTVALLNNIVMRFDELAQHHGVEKIKTIGDAYMVASGIPEPQDDHTQRLARMGLDMLSVVKEIRERSGLDLDMRVGLASGPVMAGVIGTKKFTYDVWGDAVNLAARLEGQSQRGRILICPRCFEAMSGKFELEAHGEIDIKGVGLQETWFITSESPNNASRT